MNASKNPTFYRNDKFRDRESENRANMQNDSVDINILRQSAKPTTCYDVALCCIFSKLNWVVFKDITIARQDA